ncbi:MAG: N-acetylmuramoyl-L-alanine amidase [Clostridiales bacterium]|nr:N-acetylmuramoyl-L-alanine amidase [Clostridiales bacterium]
MPKKEDISKFKQIIDKLPEDKKQLLYKRLRSMPENEREAFISDYIKKYYRDNKKPAEKNFSLSIILGFLVALVIIGSCYFIYVFNKPKVDDKFNEMLGMPPSETIDTSPNTDSIMGPEPMHFPTDTPTPAPATPSPSPVPLQSEHPDLSGLVIVIDPGHQQNPNTELEESIPGTTAQKERATSGAVGVNVGTREYELTLRYSLILKDYLEGCGAKVILTRTENDVDISNIERAEIALENDADYFIRIHADSAPDGDIRGVKVYVPSTGKYASGAESSGEALADAVAEAIGSESLGAVQSNMYTGLNHADSIRSYQLVIGYLSNGEDEALLNQEGTPYDVAVAVSEFLAE